MNNDLISREALKKATKSFTDCDGFNPVWQIIDNAPTVEPTFGLFKEMLCGTCQAYMRIEPERQTGEWIAREDMDYLDENKVVHNHFECNKCRFIHDFIDGHTSQYNYCPNCGAKMKGGNDNG